MGHYYSEMYEPSKEEIAQRKTIARAMKRGWKTTNMSTLANYWNCPDCGCIVDESKIVKHSSFHAGLNV